jgi:uncharacterized RDD family membrane protein YckC
MSYAGFWKRFAALILDTIILIIPTFIIGLIFGIALSATNVGEEGIEGLANVFGLFLGWLYNSIMDSSSKQGTLGKMALGIKVTDLNGNRIGFGKATGRYFGKILSAITLCIGYMMAGFTEKKQGLHDMMAGCLVVNK